jgi:hypothetical protein
MDLDRSWISFLRGKEKARQTAARRVECVLCCNEVLLEGFSEHFRTTHSDHLNVEMNEKALNDFIQTKWREIR